MYLVTYILTLCYYALAVVFCPTPVKIVVGALQVIIGIYMISRNPYEE